MKDERKHLTAAEVDRKCDVIQKLHNDIERRRQVKIRLFLDEDIQDSMRIALSAYSSQWMYS